MKKLAEDTIEFAELDWLSQVRCTHVHGEVVTLGKPNTKRASNDDSMNTVFSSIENMLLPKLITGQVILGSSP